MVHRAQCAWHRALEECGKSGALAAAMGAVGVATVWLLSNLNMQTIQTDRGERRGVALTDGSVVQVAPQPRLRIRFEAGSRRVVLERGRALFRVRPIGQNLDHRRKV